MSPSDSVTCWIHGVRNGVPEAARHLYQRYFERLLALAHRQLPGVPLRTASAEDVAVDAFASFCVRLGHGGFTRLEDREGLWALLAGIIVNKALKLRRYHAAAKRQRPLSEHDPAELASRDLPPDELAESGEEFQRLLSCLPEDLRKLALLKLQGFKNEEIAKQLGCVRRTVERMLRTIRTIWESREGSE
jgi:RNA polymerase sigma factor (sigma-70 family)